MYVLGCFNKVDDSDAAYLAYRKAGELIDDVDFAVTASDTVAKAAGVAMGSVALIKHYPVRCIPLTGQHSISVAELGSASGHVGKRTLTLQMICCRYA